MIFVLVYYCFNAIHVYLVGKHTEDRNNLTKGQYVYHMNNAHIYRLLVGYGNICTSSGTK